MPCAPLNYEKTFNCVGFSKKFMTPELAVLVDLDHKFIRRVVRLKAINVEIQRAEEGVVCFLSHRYAGSDPNTEPVSHPNTDPQRAPAHGMLNAQVKA